METTYTAPASGPARRSHQGLALGGFIVVSQLAGLIGVGVGNPQQFYAELTRPDWAPSPAVFGPVWMVLYTLMGIAAWLVWRKPEGRARRVALGTFFVQLALNALWTPVFFGLERIDLALVVIIGLVGALLLTIVRFVRMSRPAGLLLLPYLGWAGFATALNASIVVLNR